SATLSVMVPPVFIFRPVAQSVVQDGSVTFSAYAVAYPLPLTNERRKGSLGFLTNIVYDNASFLTLTDVQTNAAANYNLVLRNRDWPFGVPSGQAALTVLPDADGDGIPDSWESLYFGGPTAADAAQDSDGDKMSNWAEYMAGTDPNDPLSYLKVDQAQPDPASNQWVRIEFHAVAAPTYTVPSSDQTPAGALTEP